MKQRNEKGQATIEFIIAFGIMLFFLTFFMTTAVNFTVGYLVQYATFKASRTYLTADNSASEVEAVLSDAQERGREQLRDFQLGGYGIKQGSLSFNNPVLDTKVMQFVGAYFLYTPPFLRLGPFKAPDDLSFLSESFLGKEPTRADCLCRLQTVFGYFCENGSFSRSIDDEVTLEDNGC